MNELPLSEERMRELREPLSDEAQMVVDLMLTVEQSVRRGEAKEEDTQEVADRITALETPDLAEVLQINDELIRGYERRRRENEASASLAQRAAEDIERARESDPSVETLGEAVEVLKRHGVRPQVEEEEYTIKLKVPRKGKEEQ